jgi:hypothetical protein
LSILGSPHSFNFFFAMGQSNWLIAKKKVVLVRHPQLSNMKQNKYVPPVYNGGISPGQKWWQTDWEIEISCSQWERLVGLKFFLLAFFCWGLGGGRRV